MAGGRLIIATGSERTIRPSDWEAVRAASGSCEVDASQIRHIGTNACAALRTGAVRSALPCPQVEGRVEMKVKRVVIVGLTAVAVLVPAAITFATNSQPASPTLIQTVRDATRAFRDVSNATGYASLGACVNSPEEGAMGIHYANFDLIGDGKVDGTTPELLIYEQRHGRLRLVGVEFLVLAADWDDPPPPDNPDGAPVLQGQLFNYVGAPNRYGLPAFYELHVWAWRDNPKGPFADFNPDVSCAEYVGDGMTGMDHSG
jgi:hypothetical protein